MSHLSYDRDKAAVFCSWAWVNTCVADGHTQTNLNASFSLYHFTISEIKEIIFHNTGTVIFLIMISLILSPTDTKISFIIPFVFICSPEPLAKLTEFQATHYDCSKLLCGLSLHHFWPRPLILTIYPVPPIWEISKHLRTYKTFRLIFKFLDWRTWTSSFLFWLFFVLINNPHVFLPQQVGVESMWYRNPDGLQKEAAQKPSDWQKKKKKKQKRRSRREKKTLDVTRCRACHPAHYLWE